MRVPAVLASCVLATILFAQISVAQECEEDSALLEDLENVQSIVEGELGLDAGSDEGVAAVSDLIPGVCANLNPVFVPLPFGGFIWLCPAPEIPCGKGKSCQVTRRLGCSCQPIKRKKKIGAVTPDSTGSALVEESELGECGEE